MQNWRANFNDDMRDLSGTRNPPLYCNASTNRHLYIYIYDVEKPTRGTTLSVQLYFKVVTSTIPCIMCDLVEDGTKLLEVLNNNKSQYNRGGVINNNYVVVLC